MCGPLLMAAGTAVSAFGSIAAGSQQAGAYGRQAGLYERQARIKGQQSGFEIARTREEGQRILGQNRAAFAENGVAGGSTSAVTDDALREVEMNVAAIRYGTRIEQDNLRFRAANARSNAKSARLGGVLGGISAGIKGATQIATYFANPYSGSSF